MSLGESLGKAQPSNDPKPGELPHFNNHRPRPTKDRQGIARSSGLFGVPFSQFCGGSVE